MFLVDGSSDDADVNPDTKLDVIPVFESSSDVTDEELTAATKEVSYRVVY